MHILRRQYQFSPHLQPRGVAIQSSRLPTAAALRHGYLGGDAFRGVAGERPRQPPRSPNCIPSLVEWGERGHVTVVGGDTRRRRRRRGSLPVCFSPPAVVFAFFLVPPRAKQRTSAAARPAVSALVRPRRHPQRHGSRIWEAEAKDNFVGAEGSNHKGCRVRHEEVSGGTRFWHRTQHVVDHSG